MAQRDRTYVIFLIFGASLMLLSGCAPKQSQLPAHSPTTVHRAIERLHSPPIVQRYTLPAPELVRTREVERELDSLARGGYTSITRALERGGEHYEIAQRIFLEEGLPLELVNVAIVESGLNPDARSPQGALGLWQFMRGTAKLYGLRTSWLIDERRDPTLSTVAAARHLRDLYATYEDWELALAAYNAGSGGIDRARIRARSNDFWELSRRGALREETRRYVARFIATSIVLKEAQSFGLDPYIVRLAASDRLPEALG